MKKTQIDHTVAGSVGTGRRVAGNALRVLGASILLGLLAACPGRIPLPERLRVDGTAELLERVQQHRVRHPAFSAEVRLTYFGPKGRVRGTASLAAMRPASLRYELQGPHGGVLEAFATNGTELQLADLKSSRFLHGPATRQNINQLLGLIPLGLGPEEWVALLFGEVPVPPSAVLTYDDALGRFVLTWIETALQRRVEVDPESSRVVLATIREASGAIISSVKVEARDAEGLPTELTLEAPPAEIGVKVTIRDISYDVSFEPDVFVLDPPRNVTPEHLGTE